MTRSERAKVGYQRRLVALDKVSEANTLLKMFETPWIAYYRKDGDQEARLHPFRIIQMELPHRLNYFVTGDELIDFVRKLTTKTAVENSHQVYYP